MITSLLEPVVGIEPTTCSLRMSCSAIEPHRRKRNNIIISIIFDLSTHILTKLLQKSLFCIDFLQNILYNIAICSDNQKLRNP